MVLACMLGQIEMPGVGSTGYGSMHGQGNPAPEMPNIAYFFVWKNPTGSFIPVARIADLLHQPGKRMTLMVKDAFIQKRA